jgi:glycine cleavage system P protein (glycine dehydrogenase) subunit 1
MRYIPSSDTDRQEMLAAIGVDSIEQLFSGIPEKLRLRRLLDIPRALSEPELLEYFRSRAARNASDFVSFTGAGVYRHHIPIIIDALVSRSEFFTAYTPYQAEISQGTLQAIFEFQTYITQLTGMDVSNASLYDGSTAVAEAVLMAQRVTGKKRFLIAKTVHPEYRAVIQTYIKNLGIEVEWVDYTEDGRLDLAKLNSAIRNDVAAVMSQSPNFFGTIESTNEIAAIAQKHEALSIVNVCEAVSLGILKPPAADIVCGEGQALGVPESFGGPHVGFLATRERYLRQMPGRLIGMGKDFAGRRAFVMTLTTREQHIRREKATSNICTNQSLCALMATIYLSTVGPKGLREICEHNILKTDYAVNQIKSRTKHRVLFPGPRFNEFVIEFVGDYRLREKRLVQNKIVPGVPLARFYPELANALLVCITETARKEHIDALVRGLE